MRRAAKIVSLLAAAVSLVPGMSSAEAPAALKPYVIEDSPALVV